VDEEEMTDIKKEDEEADGGEEDRDMHGAGQPNTRDPDEPSVHAASE